MISRLISILIILLLSPLLLLVITAIYFDDGMPFIISQDRKGLDNKTFKFYKFRTMFKNTPKVASRLLKNPEMHLLFTGKFFRKLSIDELPQLINILKGEMNFIGPRPVLDSEKDLIELRRKYNIDSIKPGVTGWAQVNGRDKLSIDDKVKLDLYYLENKSLLLNIKILYRTLIVSLLGKDVYH